MTRTATRILRYIAILVAIFVGGFMADVTPDTWQSKGTVLSQAEAVYGRPRTPVSAAGHARRTYRHRHGY